MYQGIYFRAVVEDAAGNKTVFPSLVVRYWAQKRANGGLKTTEFFYHMCAKQNLKLRNTGLGCKPFTLISSRMYIIPKHLRAST